MKLYLLSFDGLSDYVEAESFAEAISLWREVKAAEWGEGQADDEEPDSCTLVHDQPVIREGWQASEQGQACGAYLPVEEMAVLDFVNWDRFAGNTERLSVFGWIDRPDGRSDFVLLRVTAEGIAFTTSSAELSPEISRRLNGGEPSSSHNACQRVEHHPKAAGLPNVVRLA